jgi:hypothetical protein
MCVPFNCVPINNPLVRQERTSLAILFGVHILFKTEYTECWKIKLFLMHLYFYSLWDVVMSEIELPWKEQTQIFFLKY